MNETVKFGAGRSANTLCRLLGCRPRRVDAIVRVRLHRPGGGRIISHRQTITVCVRRRCDLVRTRITVDTLDAEALDWVTVEPEVNA